MRRILTFSVLLTAACGTPPQVPAPVSGPSGTAPAVVAADPHSFARPLEAAVRHVHLDLRADFSAQRLAGTATLTVQRAPGAREQRWAHLMCGPVDTSAGVSAPSSGGGGSTGTSAALQARVDALETEVANLRTTVQRLCSELGISPDSAPMSPPGQD